MDFECQERHACVESIFLDNDDTTRRHPTTTMYVAYIINVRGVSRLTFSILNSFFFLVKYFV